MAFFILLKVFKLFTIGIVHFPMRLPAILVSLSLLSISRLLEYAYPYVSRSLSFVDTATFF